MDQATPLSPARKNSVPLPNLSANLPAGRTVNTAVAMTTMTSKSAPSAGFARPTTSWRKKRAKICKDYSAAMENASAIKKVL